MAPANGARASATRSRRQQKRLNAILLCEIAKYIRVTRLPGSYTGPVAWLEYTVTTC